MFHRGAENLKLRTDLALENTVTLKHLMQTQNDHTLIQVNINACGHHFDPRECVTRFTYVQTNKISINPRKMTAPATMSF